MQKERHMIFMRGSFCVTLCQDETKADDHLKHLSSDPFCQT